MGLDNLDEMPDQGDSRANKSYSQEESFAAVREFIDERGYFLQSDFNDIDEYPNAQTVKRRMVAEDPSMVDMLQETGATDKFVSFREPDLESWSPQETNQKLVQLACQMVEEQPGRSVRDVYYGMRSKGIKVEPNQVEEIMEKGRRHGWIDPDKVYDMSKRPTQGYTPDSGEPVEYVHEVLESAKQEYFRDWWEETDVRVQVWMEKQSLEPFVKPICVEYNVPLELWSGYWSDSRIYRKCKKLIKLLAEGTDIKILYFGDFNTNGLHIPVATQNIMRHYGVDLGRDEDRASDSSEPTYFDIWPHDGAIKPGINLDDTNLSIPGIGTEDQSFVEDVLEIVEPAKYWDEGWDIMLQQWDFSEDEIDELQNNSIFAGTIEFDRIALTINQITNEFSDLPQDPNPYESDKSKEERNTLENHITSHLENPDVAIELNALKEYYPERFEDMVRNSITEHLDEEVMERVKEETEDRRAKIEEAVSVDETELT